MEPNDKPRETKQKSQRPKHWVLWTLVSIFIGLFIVSMLVVDHYYAPDEINAPTLPDAVGN